MGLSGAPPSDAPQNRRTSLGSIHFWRALDIYEHICRNSDVGAIFWRIFASTLLPPPPPTLWSDSRSGGTFRPHSGALRRAHPSRRSGRPWARERVRTPERTEGTAPAVRPDSRTDVRDC